MLSHLAEGRDEAEADATSLCSFQDENSLVYLVFLKGFEMFLGFLLSLRILGD